MSRSRKRRPKADHRRIVAVLCGLLGVAAAALAFAVEHYGGQGVLPTWGQLYDMLGVADNAPDAEIVASGQTSVTFLDVGQGDSVLICQDGEFCLIDAGTPDSADSLVAALRAAGVDELAYLVMTHPHADHIGGMPQVLESFDTGLLILPDLTEYDEESAGLDRTLAAAADNGVPMYVAMDGDTFTLGGGTLTVLQAGEQPQNEEDAIDENLDLKSELANKKGSLLTRFFETVAAIFNPIVPALAGCGFLSAFISIFMAFGASTSDPTFNVITSVSMAVFTFLPFLLAASAAKVFKMNQFVALTICAGMMSSTWSGLIAEGVETYTFLGIPFRVIDYSSSVLPIVFAILLASYVERFLDKYIPGALKIILVPALTILIATPVTLLTVGPLTYWIGKVLASGVNMLFEYGGVFAGLVYGGIYSAMVVLGIHHGMVPVLTQMIADQGFNYVSPTSGAANIGQAGAAFGIWLKTRDKALKGNAASACFAACTGITEPVVYGVNVPLGKPFLFASIGGACGGAFAAAFHLKAYVIGGPSFLSFGMFMGGENPMYNCAMVMAGFVIAFVVAAVLTVLFWKPDEKKAANQAK